MKTQYQTSLEAYNQIQLSLPEKRLTIYTTLQKLGVANNQMIARELKWPINCVTGRINELVKLGYVFLAKTDLCPYTHYKTKFWSTRPNVM